MLDKIKCKHIYEVINLEVSLGNEIKEITHGWSEADTVVDMVKGLTTDVRDKYKENSGMEYWSYKGSPHNPPDEGFKCHKCSAVVSFPKAHSR